MTRRIAPVCILVLITSFLLLLSAGCGSSGSTTASNGNPQPQPSPQPSPTPQPSPQPSPSPTPSPTPTPAAVHDFAFITNQLSDSISGYSFDGTKAAPTPGSPYVTDFGPAPILANAAGTLVFAVMEEQAPTVKGSNCFNAPGELISYSVDATSGALALVQRLTLQKFCLYGAAIQGSTLYLIGKDQTPDNFLEVVNFDASGNMTEGAGSPFDLGSSGLDLFKLAVSPGGNFLFATQRNATVNGGVPGLVVFQKQADGSWQPSSTVPVTAQWDIALTPDGRTMMTVDMNGSTASTYTVDPSTGIVTPHGAIATVDHPMRVVAAPSGHLFAVAAANGIWMFAVDAAGNVSTVSGSPFAAGPTYISAAFDSKGQYLTAIAAGDTAYIFAVNSSGALLKIAGPLPVGQYAADVVMLSK